jgi:hypothetical protein
MTRVVENVNVCKGEAGFANACSTGDLRPLQTRRPEALMVEGQVGQPLSAVPDQGLRAYPLRDMPELPSRRRTATQDHPTILGQYQ